jgi:TetR/AcrR family transcriptional repressor of bet genes
MTKLLRAPVRRSRGRPPNTDARRAQIVDGLYEVLARDGYARATIAKIAKAAKLSPGLIHYHFAHKQAILVALVETLTRRVEERIDARLDDAEGPRQRLEAFVDAYVARGRDADLRAAAAWVIVGAEAVREPEVRALYREAVAAAHARLRRLVAEALRAEGRAVGNAGRIAAAIVSLIEGAFRVSVAGVLPEGFAAATLRHALRGLLDAEARS